MPSFVYSKWLKKSQIRFIQGHHKLNEVKQNHEYFQRYYHRLKKHRKKYFFEKVDGLNWKEIQSMRKVFRWVKEDIIFIAIWSFNIIRQISVYGSIIRKEYGHSYWNQLKRLIHIRFVLRTSPRHFRTRLLFKEKNWERVNDFVLNHSVIQKKLVQYTSLNEYETFINKYSFRQYCVSKGIPSPEIFAVLEKGRVSCQKFKELIPERSFFVKNLSGGRGERTQKFEFVNGTYLDSLKNTYSAEVLESKIKSMSLNDGDILLQPLLRNHETWMKFTPGSLATCRIVTAKKPSDHKIIPLFGCFRMPVGNSDADNHTSGGIITPVDINTGNMGIAVTSEPRNGKFEFSHHPDTKHQIVGEVLPRWSELLNFTLDIHKHFKSVFVGWDVSLTMDGIFLIEGNVCWDSGSYEIPFQDSLKNTMYPKLFEKWMENYESIQMSDER